MLKLNILNPCMFWGKSKHSFIISFIIFPGIWGRQEHLPKMQRKGKKNYLFIYLLFLRGIELFSRFLRLSAWWPAWAATTRTASAASSATRNWWILFAQLPTFSHKKPKRIIFNLKRTHSTAARAPTARSTARAAMPWSTGQSRGLGRPQSSEKKYSFIHFSSSVCNVTWGPSRRTHYNPIKIK